MLSVKVSTAEKVIWEGEAESVSSHNTQGPFEILLKHANFITIIRQKPIIIRRKDFEKVFNFDLAVIHTHDSIVRIYSDL